jgi:hypothetical protein
MVFLATSDKAHNQAFNVTNGDLYRWCNLWPRLASSYGIPCGQVRTLNLATWMADKQPVWDRIVKRHGLKPMPMDSIAKWPFGDFLWRQNQDNISSTTKLRQIGFHDMLDTEAMYMGHIARYREAKILP